MHQFTKFSALIASVIHTRKARFAIMVIAIALFVLSAGAPNASIGIGK